MNTILAAIPVLFCIVLVIIITTVIAIAGIFYLAISKNRQLHKTDSKDYQAKFLSETGSLEHLELKKLAEIDHLEKLNNIAYTAGENNFIEAAFGVAAANSNADKINLYFKGYLVTVPEQGLFFIKTLDQLIKISVSANYYAEVFLDEQAIGNWDDEKIGLTGNKDKVDTFSIRDKGNKLLFHHNRPPMKVRSVSSGIFTAAPGLNYQISGSNKEIIAEVAEGSSLATYGRSLADITDNFSLKILPGSLNDAQKALIIAFVLYHKL